MAAKKKKPVKWMKKAFSKNKGALHCQMGVPMGMTIPASMLKKAAGKGGQLGQRARAAQTGAKISRRNAKKRGKKK